MANQKLYQRQNYNTGELNTPSAPGPQFITMGHEVSNALNYLAQESNRMSMDSYALGKKEILNDIVGKAYQLHPKDSKAFLATVQKNFRKSIDGMPHDMQMDAFHSINRMVDSYGVQIQENIKKEARARLGRQTSNLYNSSLSSMQAAYNNMIDANVAGANFNLDGKLSDSETEKGKKSYRDQLLAHTGAYNKAKMDKLTAENAIDSDGNRIIRGGGDIDRVSAWMNKMWAMNKDELEQFDEQHFRDRNGFMKAMDLNDKEYKALDSYMKDLRKEWDNEREERKKSGADYTAMRLATNFDESTAESLKKEYPTVFTDEFIDTMRNNSKIEAKDLSTQMTDQDMAFLGQIGQLADLSKHRMSDTPESRAEFWKLYGDTVNNVNTTREKLGTTEEMKKQVDNVVESIATNQEFADALSRSVYDNTPIGREIARQAHREWYNPRRWINVGDAEYDHSYSQDVKDKKKIIASDGAKAIVMQASRLNTPEAQTAEGKQKILKDLDDTATYYNRRLIAAQYKDYYAEQDLLEMQKKFEQNGTKSPMIINGITYKFAGFTNDGIVLEK